MLPALTRPRAAVEELLIARDVDAAELVLDALEVTNESSAAKWRLAFERWRDKTRDTLLASYSTDEPAREFMRVVSAARAGVIELGPIPWNVTHEGLSQRITEGRNALRSLRERLEFLDDSEFATANNESGVDAKPAEAETSPPRFVTSSSHEWAIANRWFLGLVFSEFDRTGDWPQLQAMQRSLAQSGDPRNVIQTAWNLPRELGHRESMPDERVVLMIFALRYVDDASELLTDYVNAFRLVAERYLTPGEEVKIKREDLTSRLGLSDIQATKVARLLLTGTPWIGGGSNELDSWERDVYEPSLVPLIPAKTVDEYLTATSKMLGGNLDEAATTSALLDLGGVGETTSKSVFLVHGHDDAAKHSVARYLEKVKGPEVIILDEQPDKGRTIIEKFEAHAATAGYAVVLLTGDDEGRTKGSEEWKLRARQNVILELGFFVAMLGRSRVALLYQENVELPSDIQGVLYLLLDSAGNWKRRLAQEMLAAGIAIDAEQALRA